MTWPCRLNLATTSTSTPCEKRSAFARRSTPTSSSTRPVWTGWKRTLLGSSTCQGRACGSAIIWCSRPLNHWMCLWWCSWAGVTPSRLTPPWTPSTTCSPMLLHGTIESVYKGSVKNDPRKAHSNINCIRMGIRTHPLKLSDLDYFVVGYFPISSHFLP